MKKILLKRCCTFLLVLSLFISFFTAVSPSSFASNAVVDSVASLGDVFKSSVNAVVGVGKVAIDTLEQAANMVSFRFSLDRTDLVSPADLLGYIEEFNSLGWLHAALATNNSLRSVYEQAKANLANSQIGTPHAYPRPDPNTSYNTVRPYIDGYGWLVDSNGYYPYCDTAEYNAYVNNINSSFTPKPFDGRWLTTNSIRDSKKVVQKSYADMDATKADLANKYPNSSISISTLNVGGLECKVIRRLEEGPGNRDWVWCDPSGLPFVYVDPDTQGSAQDWNYDKIQDITNNQTQEITNIVTEQGDKIDKLIEINNDTSEMKVNVPVQVGPNEWSLLTLNADQITIDRSEDNRTIYQIDSHDVTYNVENNYYEYNYYTYNFEYTYNNTYVTYIGSTAEYQPKEWALYYELPDGRSSADLTEEDIAGLSFQFQDMVNYKRSATDTSLRALYHFDGNTEDSSYWSTQGAFTWNSGASITYMESNAFNGALYLDEKAHQFTITLPSSIGSQDFSLQWRYYQNSATTTDHNENYVIVGGQKLLGWSEQSLYSLGSTKLSTGLSVGTWQELALVRNSGTLYLYHNGVKVGSASMTSVLTDKIVFYLGANSRAYSMLDELRVVNFAIAKGGASYTPTAVPHDTNSVLILPDGAFPIADEYWEWDTSIAPVVKQDFTSGVWVPTSHSTSMTTYKPAWMISPAGSYMSSVSFYSCPCYNKSWSATNNSFYTGDGYVHVQANAIPNLYENESNSTSLGSTGKSLIYGFISNNRGAHADYGTFTADFVTVDGNVYSFTFEVPQYPVDINSPTIASKTFGSFSVTVRDFYSGLSSSAAQLGLAITGTVDLVYMDIVKGSVGNTGHKFVSAVYSSDELQPNTAAIQSTIPVKGYTVGGVRPTFPERGDVWMPVEGSRISGVYIYNGQAWEETNARYWTGKRWIPIYAFDLVTLADMWDVGSSSGQEVAPSITSEYGFWNWWQKQWLDFRQWLAENLGGGGGGSIIFPSPSECEHTYAEKVLTSPTCTQKGTALYFCTKCGDSYTEAIDASGHDWVMKDSIPDELGEAGEVETPGYDLYRCSICGEEYKDYTRTGPPGAESGSTLSELIQQLFGALGDLVGSLVDWVLELGKEAMEGFGSLGEFFQEKAEEVQGFGGEYVGFLGVFFEIIPPEIKTCISLALILFGLSLFIRKVIL